MPVSLPPSCSVLYNAAKLQSKLLLRLIILLLPYSKTLINFVPQDSHFVTDIGFDPFSEIRNGASFWKMLNEVIGVDDTNWCWWLSFPLDLIFLFCASSPFRSSFIMLFVWLLVLGMMVGVWCWWQCFGLI